MKDYLTKELEKYEKEKKARSLDSDKEFYNFYEDDNDVFDYDDEDDKDDYEDDDDIEDYDEDDDYDDDDDYDEDDDEDDVNDKYERNDVENNDEDTTEVSAGDIIRFICDVLVAIIICTVILFSFVSWNKYDSGIDSSSTLEVNLDDSSVIDNTTSNSNEIDASSGEVDVSSGAIVDHISYKGLEPGKKYYIYVNVYDKNENKLKKTYKKEFIAESNNKENIDVSYHMPKPTNPLQGFYSTYMLSDK